MEHNKMATLVHVVCQVVEQCYYKNGSGHAMPASEGVVAICLCTGISIFVQVMPT